ncbi:MAG: DUF1501 domain-containing protein, partial [Planctomycetaceae bacterium]|nr:DUF1501 domain-containing protein [Planctomycetaceae bacterium]
MGLSQAVGQQVVRYGPKAKSVIFVFLWGAPSHLDTCDPKPDAPMEFRGPFHSIATRTPGLNFTELLPRMASRSDRFSIIRTHATSEPGHPDGGTMALTGFLHFFQREAIGGVPGLAGEAGQCLARDGINCILIG